MAATAGSAARPGRLERAALHTRIVKCADEPTAAARVEPTLCPDLLRVLSGFLRVALVAIKAY